MKNPFADNKCKSLSKRFGIGLCRNANYMVNINEKLHDPKGMTRVYLFLA